MKTKQDIELLTQKALNGDAGAQNDLGCAYDNGDGVTQDHRKAFDWFMKSANQGNYYAQYNIGVMYRYGQGVEKSYPDAFKWYMKSAQQGYAKAEEAVGIFYDYGYGVEKDDRNAFEWYEKAAMHGANLAQNNLGTKYEFGNGVAKNCKIAYNWYLSAAKQGNEYAECNIGILYEEGKGVVKNLKTALSWYRKSAAHGHQRAKDKIKELLDNYDEHIDKWILKVGAFKKNPFRILGVYSNATSREITANRSRLNAFAKIGRTVEFPTDKIVSSLYVPKYAVANSNNEPSLDVANDDLDIHELYKQIRKNDKVISENQDTPASNVLLNGNEQSKPESDIKKRQYELKVRSLYNTSRSADTAEEMLAAISQPKDRLKYSFFWFVKVSPNDKSGIDALMLGHINEAKDFFSADEEYSSLINRAIVAFIEEDPVKYAECMQSVISDDNKRAAFVSAVCGDNFIITKEELIHIFIDTLLAELSFVDWGKVFTPNGIHYKNEDEVYSPFRDYINELKAKRAIGKISDAITKVSPENASNGEDRYQQGMALMEVLPESLYDLKSAIGVNSIKYQQYADKAADALLDCSVDYYNNSSDKIYDTTKQCLELTEYARSISVGTLMKERADKLFDQIQERFDSMPSESTFNMIENIQEKLNEFANKPKTCNSSKELLTTCFPLLGSVKEELGKGNNNYIDISTNVAAIALSIVITAVNNKMQALKRAEEEYKNKPYVLPLSLYSSWPPTPLKPAYDALTETISASWLVMLNIEQIDMDPEFRDSKFAPNKATLLKHVKDLKLDVQQKPSMTIVTDTEAYNSAKTVKQVNSYIQRFPKGKHIVKAKEKYATLKKADDSCWEECSRVKNYKQYLEKNPDGLHSEEAKEEITKIEILEDDNFWEACSLHGNYKQYLKEYPNGRHVKTAKDFIEKNKNRMDIIMKIAFALMNIAIILGAIFIDISVLFFGGALWLIWGIVMVILMEKDSI